MKRTALLAAVTLSLFGAGASLAARPAAGLSPNEVATPAGAWQSPAVRRPPLASALRPWASIPELPPPGTTFPWRAAPAGSANHTYATAAASTNWAGLVFDQTQFGSISADWSVPTVQPSTTDEASGTWVGIGGYGAGNDSIIQTGTGQDSGPNGTVYYAWVEVYPDPVQILGGVSPRDDMSADIFRDSGGNWNLSIRDTTQGVGTGGQVPYTGPASSAEWIEEAPADANGNVAPLADFGSVSFLSAHSGYYGAPGATTLSYIADSAGNILAYPTNFQSASFDVRYGSPPSSSTQSTTTTAQGEPTTTTPPPASPTTQTGSSAPTSCASPTSHPPTPVDALAATDLADGCAGYWIATASGGVIAFGSAPSLGDLGGQTSSPVAAVVATPDGRGYWLALSDGTVDAFGDAQPFGAMSGQALNGRIVAMAATPDGRGYWLIGSDGGVFTFGDARFWGSTGAMRLNDPVVGIAPTPSGNGYWLVAGDGGVFTFGDAEFLGSMGGVRLNRPVVGMTADPAGRGYRMVASDGGIFSFGAPFYGSLGATPPASPVVSMAPSPDGDGYYLLSADGAVYTFGDAPYFGNA